MKTQPNAEKMPKYGFNSLGLRLGNVTYNYNNGNITYYYPYKRVRAKCKRINDEEEVTEILFFTLLGNRDEFEQIIMEDDDVIVTWVDGYGNVNCHVFPRSLLISSMLKAIGDINVIGGIINE